MVLYERVGGGLPEKSLYGLYYQHFALSYDENTGKGEYAQ